MPLLLCPNDNSSMQAVKRHGVELDICPTCRGVWLDRGELEKILEGGRELEADRREAVGRFERDVDDFRRDPDDWRRRHPYDAERKRHGADSDHYRHKKKKGFDLFDFFD